MKIAVLIVNYALIVLLVFIVLTAAADPNTASDTITGCIVMLPAPILAVIYAHQQKGKK